MCHSFQRKTVAEFSNQKQNPTGFTNQMVPSPFSELLSTCWPANQQKNHGLQYTVLFRPSVHGLWPVTLSVHSGPGDAQSLYVWRVRHPCDTITKLKLANPDPQNNLRTNIILCIVEVTWFHQSYRKIFFFFAILLSEKYEMSNLPAKLKP